MSFTEIPTVKLVELKSPGMPGVQDIPWSWLSKGPAQEMCKMIGHQIGTFDPYTLEVNHHVKNGGSCWMMIKPLL